MRSLLFALLLLSPAPAMAQVLETTAGGGTLLSGGTPGGGGAMTMYLPHQNLYFSGNYYQNHFIFGASSEFNVGKLDVTAGSKLLGFASGGVGVGLSLVGISATKLNEKNRSSLTVFAGMTGQGFLMPYAFGVKAKHIGTGILYQRKFKNGLYLSSLDVLNGGSYSLAQGIGYRHGDSLDASISAGLITNQRYFNGVVYYQPSRFLSMGASHQSYFNPYSATGNGINLGLSIECFSLQGSINNSDSLGLKVVGESAGLGVHVHWLAGQSSWYHSGQQTFLNHQVMQTFRRWSATEGITSSAGGRSFTLGGSYHTNRMSLSVNHGLQFLLNGRGYQSVTSGSISVRIGALVVNGQAQVDPFGKTLWSSWGERYSQTGLKVPEGRGFVSKGGGKYTITGKCLEADRPMEGCAIVIGKETIYSNRDGIFELRVKKNASVNVMVSLDDFTNAGTYQIISAPTTAKPGDVITIIVRRS